MATKTKETQKAGDTLILSGAFAQDTPIADDAWIGAVAKLNMVNADTLAVVIDHGDATIDLTPLSADPPGPPRYTFIGTMPDPDATYLYELEVTFSDGKVRTWPNDGSKHALKVIPQFG